jgi:hypothetical protein
MESTGKRIDCNDEIIMRDRDGPSLWQLEKPYKKPIKENKQEPKTRERNQLIINRRQFRVWLNKRRELRFRRDTMRIQLTLINRNTI